MLFLRALLISISGLSPMYISIDCFFLSQFWLVCNWQQKASITLKTNYIAEIFGIYSLHCPLATSSNSLLRKMNIFPWSLFSFYRASSQHSVSSKSFRDFLVEEKKSVTGQRSGDHVKKVCFKGIENSQSPKVVR